MRILIVSATKMEIQPLLDTLLHRYQKRAELRFAGPNLQVDFLITGVGIPSTLLSLAKTLSGTRFDLVLNLGVAGSFRADWMLGSVFSVWSERFGDIGVEEKNGDFSDVFDLSLAEPDAVPFQGGWLCNPSSESYAFLPKARGLTVNKVHGAPKSIERIHRKYPEADLESMEGAAFFLACLEYGVPFLEIRALSNYVEPRNKNNWQLGLAVQNLNHTAWELIDATKKIF